MKRLVVLAPFLVTALAACADPPAASQGEPNPRPPVAVADAAPEPVVAPEPEAPEPEAPEPEAPEPAPEPVAKPDPKPEPVAKPDPKPEPVVKPKPKPEPVRPTKLSAREAFEASQKKVGVLAEREAGDKALRAEVDRFLDYEWLAEASLGGKSKYAERCGSRCDEFEAALTELIRHNYLLRVRDANRGTVTYTGEEVRNDGTLAKVDTSVTFDDAAGTRHTLEVDYVMHLDGGAWKVRDIYTDGVGLSKTYRYEFRKMLDEGGIDLVIERLRDKIAEIERAS